MASYDMAAPVPVVAIGSKETTEITVTWSEPVTSDGAGTGFGAINASTMFEYEDANGTDASAIAATPISYTLGTEAMIINTDVALTLSDVETDSLWVNYTGAPKFYDDANAVYNTLADNSAEQSDTGGWLPHHHRRRDRSVDNCSHDH